MSVTNIRAKLWRLDLPYDAAEGTFYHFRNDNPDRMVITCGEKQLGSLLPGEEARCTAVRVGWLRRWWRSLWHSANPSTEWRVGIDW